MYTPINQWAEDDRPREKFLLKGRVSLSDSELLAILIGSGSRNESAVQLCQRILASTNNNLNLLGKLSVQQLIQFKGIGEAKAHCHAGGNEKTQGRVRGALRLQPWWHFGYLEHYVQEWRSVATDVVSH